MKFKSIIQNTGLFGRKKVLLYFNNQDLAVLNQLLKKIDVIASGAFTKSAVEEIVIPAHIEIEDMAFSSCGKLKKATILNGAQLAHKGIFAECVQLNRVEIGKNCATIGESCFRNTDLTFVSLPEGVKEVSQNAFLYSNLRRIDLPESTKHICADAFKYCPLEEINAPKTCVVDDETAKLIIFKQNLIENPNFVSQSLIKQMINFHKTRCEGIRTRKILVDHPLLEMGREQSFVDFLQDYVQE